MRPTKRQQQILTVIREHIRKNKYPPTLREICELTGLKSSSSVHRHLEDLRQKGYVNWEPAKPRTLHVVNL